MGNLKNFFFVAAFMLLGFNVQAETNSHITSTYSLALNVPQTDGVVDVSQGRNALTVTILTGGPVKLIVHNESGEVIFQRFARPQVRQIAISISDYESGNYTLYAVSRIGVQTVDFDITK